LNKLTAITFATLILASALMVGFSQPVSALPNESSHSRLSFMISQVNTTGNETIIPGSENGLIVAVGGIIAVVMFLLVILLNVLKKRKKKMHE